MYVFLAQILSLIICGTGVVNNKLFDSYKVNIPTSKLFFNLNLSYFFSLLLWCYFKIAQTIINYILLALIYTPIWFYYVKDRKIIFNLIKKNWWKYLLITFADVEANYLITKAYSLTLVTTIQVCFRFKTKNSKQTAHKYLQMIDVSFKNLHLILIRHKIIIFFLKVLMNFFKTYGCKVTYMESKIVSFKYKLIFCITTNG